MKDPFNRLIAVGTLILAAFILIGSSSAWQNYRFERKREVVRSSVLRTYHEGEARGELPKADGLECYAYCFLGYPNMLRVTNSSGEFLFMARSLKGDFNPPWKIEFIRGLAADGTFVTNWHEASTLALSNHSVTNGSPVH